MLTRRRALGLMISAVTAGTAAAQGFTSTDDVRYADMSPRNRMDLHLPDGSGPFPFLLDIHGGGFLTGDKSALPVPDQVIKAGIAVIRMNYRFSNQSIWPAQLDDVLAALTFLRQRAGAYRLNAQRFALGGRSAGAFLAVSAALSLVENGRPPRAVVDFYGPMDFGSMDADMAALHRKVSRAPADSVHSAESLLVGYPVGEDRRRATATSPVGRLRALPPNTRLPPLMIRHGALDSIVSVHQAEHLRRAWHDADPDAAIDFAILPNAGHGTREFAAAMQGPMAEFLSRHLVG